MVLRAGRGRERAGLASVVSLVSLVSLVWLGGIAPAAVPGTAARDSPDGGTAVELTLGCSRRERPPLVAAVSPGGGWTLGGGTVTITGSGFARVVAVTFGRTWAGRLRVLSARRLQVAAPKHAAGKVSVVVRTECGASKHSRRALYTYRLRPTLPTTPPPTSTPPVTTGAGSGVLSIVAGRIGVLTPGAATATPIGPNGVAASAAGDLYIADAHNDVVEKVTPAGILSIIAGVSGQAGAPTPGPATSSDLGDPTAVAVDGAGNLYIADSGDDVVEKVTPDGTLSVVAGVPGALGAPTPGPAASSDLANPSGVTVDGAGNLYIADPDNDVVEKVTPGGVLSVAAGVPAQFGAPTPGPAASSDLANPSGVTVDGAGNLYIADPDNDVVEKVTPGGVLSLAAGVPAQFGAPTPGPATSSDLGLPESVALDGAGNLYIADPDNYVVERVTPGGELTVAAGDGQSGAPTPGPSTSSELGSPSSVAVDGQGNLYIADAGNDVVERATPEGILAVVAGYTPSGGPSPGPATSSNLNLPLGVAVDGAGNLYIADTGNSVVERVTPAGVLSIVAGVPLQSGAPTPGPATSSDLGAPAAVAVGGAGNLYIADTANDVVDGVTPAGALSVVAGVPGESGAPTAGPAARSDLGDPAGVAVDRAGNLYIADTASDVVEKVTAGGTLSVVAGDGELGTPTPGPATSSDLGAPAAVAVDGSGNLYIADTANDVVEKVTADGTLSVIAGMPGKSGAASSGPATSSSLGNPSGVAIDGAGNVYIADTANDVVERVTPAGALSVVAGDGEFGAPTPGPATSSDLGDPAGVAVDAAGNIYIADTDNSDIEAVSAP